MANKGLSAAIPEDTKPDVVTVDENVQPYLDKGVINPVVAGGPSEFARGIKRGTSNLYAGLWGSVEALGSAVDNDAVQTYGEAKRHENEAEATKYPRVVQDVQSIEGIEDLFTWAYGGLGELAPFIALSAGTGAAGAVAGRLAGIAASTGARAGAFTGITGVETGSTFGEIKDESGIEAPLQSLLAGSAIAGLDVFALGKAVGRLAPGRPGAGKYLRRVAKDLGEQTFIEGVTEGAQEAIAAGTHAFVSPTFDFATEETARRIIDAAAVGALGGAVGGGAAGVVGNLDALSSLENLDIPGLTQPLDEGGILASQNVDVEQQVTDNLRNTIIDSLPDESTLTDEDIDNVADYLKGNKDNTKGLEALLANKSLFKQGFMDAAKNVVDTYKRQKTMNEVFSDEDFQFVSEALNKAAETGDLGSVNISELESRIESIQNKFNVSDLSELLNLTEESVKDTFGIDIRSEERVLTEEELQQEVPETSELARDTEVDQTTTADLSEGFVIFDQNTELLSTRVDELQAQFPDQEVAIQSERDVLTSQINEARAQESQVATTIGTSETVDVDVLFSDTAEASARTEIVERLGKDLTRAQVIAFNIADTYGRTAASKKAIYKAVLDGSKSVSSVVKRLGRNKFNAVKNDSQIEQLSHTTSVTADNILDLYAAPVRKDVSPAIKGGRQATLSPADVEPGVASAQAKERKTVLGQKKKALKGAISKLSKQVNAVTDIKLANKLSRQLLVHKATLQQVEKELASIDEALDPVVREDTKPRPIDAVTGLGLNTEISAEVDGQVVQIDLVKLVKRYIKSERAAAEKSHPRNVSETVAEALATLLDYYGDRIKLDLETAIDSVDKFTVVHVTPGRVYTWGEVFPSSKGFDTFLSILNREKALKRELRKLNDKAKSDIPPSVAYSVNERIADVEKQLEEVKEAKFTFDKVKTPKHLVAMRNKIENLRIKILIQTQRRENTTESKQALAEAKQNYSKALDSYFRDMRDKHDLNKELEDKLTETDVLIQLINDVGTEFTEKELTEIIEDLENDEAYSVFAKRYEGAEAVDHVPFTPDRQMIEQYLSNYVFLFEKFSMGTKGRVGKGLIARVESVTGIKLSATPTIGELVDAGKRAKRLDDKALLKDIKRSIVNAMNPADRSKGRAFRIADDLILGKNIELIKKQMRVKDNEFTRNNAPKPPPVTTSSVFGSIASDMEELSEVFKELVKASVYDDLPKLNELESRERISEISSWVQTWLDRLNIKGVNVQIISTNQAVDFAMQHNEPTIGLGITSGGINGFVADLKRNPDGTFSIKMYISPLVTKDQTLRDVIAHELGHVIHIYLANKLHPKHAAAVIREYEAWRKEYGKPEVNLQDLLSSKQTPALVQLVSREVGNVTTDEMPANVREYMLSFDEWFADNVARWEFSDAKPQTVVEKFFRRVALLMQKLFSITMTRHSVHQLMDDMYNDNGWWKPGVNVWASVSSTAAGSNIEFSKTFTGDTLDNFKEIYQQITGKNIDDVENVEISDQMERLFIAAALSKDVGTSAAMHEALRDIFQNDLNEHERSILGRAALSAPIQRQLQQKLGFDRELTSRITDPESAAALMYMMWQAGQLSIGPQTKTLFTKFNGWMNDTLGIVTDLDNAENIFEAIQQGEIVARRMNSGSFVVHRLVSGSIAEKFHDSLGNAWKSVGGVFTTLFSAADEQLRTTGNPALIQLANMFHTKAGDVNGPNTFIHDKTKYIGEFHTIYTNMMNNLPNEEDRVQLAEALLNKDKYKQAPARIKRVADKVFYLTKLMHKYAKSRGLEMGEIQDYFPWVMDVEFVQNNKQEFLDLVNQEKFQDERTKLATSINFNAVKDLAADTNMTEAELRVLAKFWAGDRSNQASYTKVLAKLRAEGIDPKDVYKVNHLTVASVIHSSIVAEEGYADINPDRQTHVPSFRYANTRILKFIEDLGDSNDRATLSSFLSKDINRTMEAYIHQIVKRTEYVHRFGVNGEKFEALLNNARNKYGATDKDIELAVNSVNAYMGTYGRQRAEALAKLLGVDPPEAGKPIDPRLQATFGAIMVWQNLRVLGLATLTSMADVVGIAVRTGDMMIALRSLQLALRRISKNATKKELTDLSSMLGLIDKDMINEALGWEYGGAYLHGKLKTANDLFFRVIGLSQWTRMTRIAATNGAMEFMKRHVQKPNKHSARYLAELRINPEDVKLGPDGRVKVLSFGERKVLQEQGNLAEIARDDRIRDAIAQFVDEAILRPDATQRPVWASDPHFMLIFHLKSFMYSFYDRILKRVVHEAANGAYLPLLQLGAFIPVMITSDVLRDLIQHGEIQPNKQGWGPTDFALNAARRAGLYGVGGTLFADAYNDVQYGGYGIESFLGPSLQTFGEPAGRWLPGQTLYYGWFNE